MSKIVYSPDKPNDCRYCHFWKNNKTGCCLGEENCYYLISVSPKPKSECEGCPYIADRRRVTKDSFERWYAGQSKYRKLCDRSPEEIMAIERKQQEAVKPRLKVDETKAAFTLQEAAVLLDLTYNEVRRLIQTGEIDARKYGTRYLIPRDDIKWFLFQQKLDREN